VAVTAIAPTRVALPAPQQRVFDYGEGSLYVDMLALQPSVGADVDSAFVSARYCAELNTSRRTDHRAAYALHSKYGLATPNAEWGAATTPQPRRSGFAAVVAEPSTMRRLRATQGAYLPSDHTIQLSFGSKDVIHS